MSQNITVSFENYLKDTKGLKDQTIKNYRADLRHFLLWLEQKAGQNPLNLKLLTPGILENYKEYLLANKMAKNTINRKLATTRTFCQFCYNRGLLEQDLTSGVNNLPVTQSEDKKIHDLVSKFGAFLKKNRSSRNTIKNYTADVRQYLIASSKLQALISKQ
ncbi:site-specific integrase [Candidatus Shapirobacteria bacterium]|nr:site-specific integrase [Candidatus Shapirobacteria bacterium]